MHVICTRLEICIIFQKLMKVCIDSIFVYCGCLMIKKWLVCKSKAKRASASEAFCCFSVVISCFRFKNISDTLNFRSLQERQANIVYQFSCPEYGSLKTRFSEYSNINSYKTRRNHTTSTQLSLRSTKNEWRHVHFPRMHCEHRGLITE